jgi:hypothetical protein
VSKPSASRRICTTCVVAAVAMIAVALLAVSPAKHRAAHAALSPSLASQSKTVPPPARERVKASFASLPLGFEQNYGQTDPQVKYMAHANGYTLFLTNRDAVFAFHARSSASERATGHGPLALQAKSESHAQPNSEAVVRMRLVGGNSNALLTATDQLPGKSNYIRGKDPKNWHTDVSHYARVSYKNIYPGINLAYHGEQSKLEFDFIVAPESNPAPIDLAFNGVQHLATDASGNLIVSSGAGDVVLHKPVAYQQQSGTRQPVDARFVLKADNQVGFELASYDRSRELVIDPTVTYATYLGGNTEDDAYAIAVDSTGAAYVTGRTDSTNFPTVGGLTTNVAGTEFAVFVTKFAASGQSPLVYSTYVDGGNTDTGSSSGNAIAVDASGDAFVAGGTSSTTLPFTPLEFQNSNAGGLDAFVFELNPAGNVVLHSTYLGGPGSDIANGVAVDGAGNVYLVGSTTSSTFPVKNPIQTSLVSTHDGFVTELNPSLSALVYSTWLGGGPADFASAVALDSANNVYVTGGTGSTTFPFTTGAFQTSCNSCTGGLYNAFVTVININAAGSSYVYSTYLGGTQNDEGLGIAVDSSGDAYVTGETSSSTSFPLQSALQHTYGGGSSDAFVTKLNPTGSALVYSTFLGGGANDVGTSIAIDGGNNAYVTGQTGSTGVSPFPTANPTQGTIGGQNDAFVSEVNSAGSQLIFSTYLGGALNENTPNGGGSGALGAIAVDGPGANIYVTGNTWSTDFPTVSPYQRNNRSIASEEINAFVAKYSQPAFTLSATALSPAAVGPGSSATSTVTISPLNGFTASVALTCAVAPSGANSPTCNFSPGTVTGGSGSATLNVVTTSSTTLGTYTVTVNGTGPTTAQTASVTLDVTDFTISATPLSPSALNPGTSGSSTVTIAPLDGFTGTVTLACALASEPASPTSPPTCQFAPSSTVIGGSGTPTFTVSTTTTTTPGAYTFNIVGTGSSEAQTTSVSFTVTAPDFTISAAAPATVSPGGSGTSTVTLTAVNGYASPVNLTCAVTGTGSPLPTCSVTGTNPQTPTASGATSTVTIKTTGATAAMVRPSKFFYAMWLPIAGLSLVGMGFSSARSRRKKLLGFLMVGMVLTALFLMPACGGSSNSGGGGGGGGGCTGCTTAGSYTVSITGTGTDPATTTHSTTVTLTVN